MELLILLLCIYLKVKIDYMPILFSIFKNFGFYFFVILKKKHFHQILAMDNLSFQIIFQKT